MISFPKPKRYISRKYEDWVRKQPCVHCQGPADPHHMKGVGNLSGAGLKAPSWAIFPACRVFHNFTHDHPAAIQWEYVARTLGKAIEEGILVVK